MLTGSALMLAQASSVSAADPFISEVMSANETTLRDSFSNSPDWIEIYNPNDQPFSLADWSLTDDPQDLQKWTFPKVSIDARQFLVVFASGENKTEPDGELHTGFRLARDGEYLGLVKPDGTIASEFKPELPALESDQSYGVSMMGDEETLLPVGAEVSYLVPTSEHSNETWTMPGYEETEDWQRGKTGIGFESSGDFGGLVETKISSGSSGIYMRGTFHFDDLDGLTRLMLLIRYDDGFVAYLNGSRVAEDNAPAKPEYDSYATGQNKSEAFRGFDLSGEIHRLKQGENVLGIHCMNFQSDPDDMLLLPTLVGGREGDIDPTNTVFLSSPTPGSINTAEAVGKAGEPIFSLPAGTFVTSFELELSSTRADEEVRYTLDGSMPTSESTPYTEPVAIESSVMVRARCFRQGSMPGSSVSNGYLKLAGNLHNFSSNLPVVVVQDFKDGNILPDPDIPRGTLLRHQGGYMMVHEPGGEDRRTRLTDAPTLETRIGIKIRGNSTQNRPKKAFTLEAWDEYDEDKDIAPLNMPEDSDWVLYAPYNFDRAMIRNAFIYEISNQIGRYAVRTRFCEVFVNTDGGSLGYEDYVGVYSFMEKITRSRNRVDIRRIDPGHSDEPEISGGYMFKLDRPDPGDKGFIAGKEKILWVDPKENEVTPEQAKWVTDYINSMYESARSSNPETGYPKYVDTDSWIDHHILNEFTKNPDAFYLSTYFFKDRGKRMEYGPIWDFDRTMGGDGDGRAVDPIGWSGAYSRGWWSRIMRTKDFKRRYVERWALFRQHAMSEKNMFAVIDAMAEELDEAAGRNFTRWPLFASNGGFHIEIGQLKNWISKRLAWIDSKYMAVPQPILSSMGGVVLPGFRLQLSGSGGDVHYTTDGTDPRMLDDSENPNAQTLSISKADMVISRDSVWKYLDDGTKLDDVQWIPLDYDDSQWKSGPAELGYGDDDEATAVNKGGSGSKTHNTIYFRRHFTLNSVNRGDRLLLELLRDDGAVVYLNGTEIIRSNMPSGTVLYSTTATSKNNLKQSRLWHSHVIDSPSITKGENVIAVEVHRFNMWDRDLSFNLELGLLDASGSSITINESTTIMARIKKVAPIKKGKDWSPPVKATFVVSEAAPLKITEIMYNPLEGNALEFIELKNLSSQPLALEGISLEGVNFQFEDGTLMPWQAGVLIPNNDPEAFSKVYPGVTILGLYGGNLSNGGELLRIHDAEKQVTFEVEYGDSGDWPEEADGTGHSLELANPAGNPKDFRNWRASALPGGSPGDVLEISVVALEPGRVQIRFFALPGNSYTLRYSDNVASGQWMRLHQKKFMANPKEVEFIDTVPGNVQRRFYRISIP